MDCEKFDQHVMDALYDELDELTHAALKRHVEGCSRCSGILSGLRATREVAMLPMVEPSDELEARILDAVATAQKKTPWPRKILRGLAWAGSHAMRPQLAMAALFFLVIGSSLLLLRAKPGTVGVAPVRVTERGAPAPEVETEAPAAAPTASPVAAAAPPAEAAATALVAQAEGPKDQRALPDELYGDGANRREKAEAKSADKDAGKIALEDARAVRGSAGCAAAVSKYDEVGARFAGTAYAADAMWEAAACYKSMGDASKARELYLALGSTGYGDRARQQLAADEANLGNAAQQNQVASRAAAGPMKAPAAAAPAPAPPPAVATEVQSPEAKGKKSAGGSPGKSLAAPKKAADSQVGF